MRAEHGDFGAWADTVLAGTGWTAASVRQAARHGRDDLATSALADGFAAAAKGLAGLGDSLGGVA